MDKMRLDAALVARGLAGGRERAKEWIRQGLVSCNGVVCRKASMPVSDTDELTVAVSDPFVSRAGEKLEAALRLFHLDVADRVCADIGASTGGFVDCLLRRHARRVYAVDVGTGQLSPQLLNDSRVVNMEKTNARYLTAADFPEPITFLSCDASFISLTLLFPAFRRITVKGSRMVCLIKPQFEAGARHLNKQGVVKDPAVHQMVIETVVNAAAENGLRALHTAPSPLLGPKGNREFLLLLEHTGDGERNQNADISDCKSQ